MPAILALGRLSQGDYELKASLDYIARRDLAILKKKKNTQPGAGGSHL
jgi:hypothetical protein